MVKVLDISLLADVLQDTNISKEWITLEELQLKLNNSDIAVLNSDGIDSEKNAREKRLTDLEMIKIVSVQAQRIWRYLWIEFK